MILVVDARVVIKIPVSGRRSVQLDIILNDKKCCVQRSASFFADHHHNHHQEDPWVLFLIFIIDTRSFQPGRNCMLKTRRGRRLLTNRAMPLDCRKHLSTLLLLFCLICPSLSSIEAYRVLGISEQATAKEIQKKYRELCLKYHPDKNGHKAARERAKAEEQFKKVQQAYSLIGDDDSRRSYDLGRRMGGSANRSYYGPSPSTPSSFAEEILRQFASGHGSTYYFTRGARGPRFGVRRSFSDTNPSNYFSTRFQSIYVQAVSVPLKTLYTGVDRHEFHLRDNLWTRWRAAVRGKIIWMNLYQALTCAVPVIRTSKVFAGMVAVVMLQATLPSPQTTYYTSKISKGTKGGSKKEKDPVAGSQIQFQSTGLSSPTVIFQLMEEKHPVYRRVDNDLHVSLSITLKQAQKGCRLQIPFLDPKEAPLEVQIPPWTQSGDAIRIVGRGWPRLNSKDVYLYGDAVVNINVEKKKRKKRPSRFRKMKKNKRSKR